MNRQLINHERCKFYIFSVRNNGIAWYDFLVNNNTVRDFISPNIANISEVIVEPFVLVFLLKPIWLYPCGQEGISSFLPPK